MATTARRIEVNGIGLHVEDTGGRGPVVMFSHGLLLSTRLWDAQVAGLRGQFRCIAYDHRGQGRSDRSHERSIGMDICAADAAALIEALGVARCHFVGLSMGGFVGMRLAARRPELLASVTLMETSADAEPAEALPRYRLMTLVARTIGPWIVAGKVMPIMFGRSFLSDPTRAGQAALWRSRIAANRRDIWRAVNGAVVHRTSFYRELGRIHTPSLVIVGEEDVATPPERAEHIAGAIPGARLVRIPRAGHTSPIEEPGAVTGALVDFFEAVESGTARLA